MWRPRDARLVIVGPVDDRAATTSPIPGVPALGHRSRGGRMTVGHACIEATGGRCTRIRRVHLGLARSVGWLGRRGHDTGGGGDGRGGRLALERGVRWEPLDPAPPDLEVKRPRRRGCPRGEIGSYGGASPIPTATAGSRPFPFRPPDAAASDTLRWRPRSSHGRRAGRSRHRTPVGSCRT